MTASFLKSPKAPEIISEPLNLSNIMREAKKERSYSRTCIQAIRFPGRRYFFTLPFSSSTPFEMRISPPTATVSSRSSTGRDMFLSESYCNTESASMQMKYGYLAAFIPMLRASALPPFFLRITVSGTRVSCVSYTNSSGRHFTSRRIGRETRCMENASIILFAVSSREPSSTTIISYER